MLKLFPKQFSADMRLLISCALTFPPSSFLPRELEPHESNYHVCERVSHNKRVSARPAGVCRIPAHAWLELGSSLMPCLLQWTSPDRTGGERRFWPKGRERCLNAVINTRAKTRVTTLAALQLQLLYKRGAKSNKSLTPFRKGSN